MTRISKKQYLSESFPLNIVEVDHQAFIEEHSHEFFEMVYVRRGRGQHLIDGAAHTIQAGDLYVISPGENHGYAPLPGETMHIVNILWMPSVIENALRAASQSDVSRGASTRESGDALSGARSLLYVEPMLRRGKKARPRFAHRLRLSGKSAFRIELLIDEMRRELAAAALGHELMLRHLFCAMLVLLSRTYEDQQSRPALPEAATQREYSRGNVAAVERAISYIETHYAKPLRVADVARAAALSPSRLSHVFKECTQKSVNAYLHEVRIARVCETLQNSSATVAAVASSCGYHDTRFFHRVFRRQVGCSPGEYRCVAHSDSQTS